MPCLSSLSFSLQKLNLIGKQTLNFVINYLPKFILKLSKFVLIIAFFYGYFFTFLIKLWLKVKLFLLLKTDNY